jgi:hypothetical protein
MPCAPSITLALKDKRKVYKAKIKRIVTGSGSLRVLLKGKGIKNHFKTIKRT